MPYQTGALPGYMRSIAVLCSDQAINSIIRSVCERFPEDFTPVFLSDKESFVQYLNYEFPEIDIVYHSDPAIDIGGAIETIKDDPWLHFGGSIVVYDRGNEQTLHGRLTGANIISLIHRSRLELYLYRVLAVLSQNRSILFQRDIHAMLQSNLSGLFVIDNDPFDVTTYSNLLANFMYNSNLINLDQKENFYSAIVELLINAIEHGNCRITFEEKREFLERTPDILDLIRRKNLDPEVGRKKVYLTYRITPSVSHFTIRDEGIGFDWRTFALRDDPSSDDFHGRGIMVARHYLGDLMYNEAGNAVSFEIQHADHESNVVPGVFVDQEEVTFQDGETVFEQGASSSHLYYIISGKFDIIANGKTISTLTPADIFLGEMSFLLNNRRSATVISRGRGVCIRISKKAFINAIKKHPHYGIFLARLLAQRLDQLHDITI